MHLAKKLGNTCNFVGARGVESRFPARDFAFAHDPHLDAEPPHGEPRVGILPFTVPDIRQRIVAERAKLFAQSISALLAASRPEEFAQCLSSAKLRQIAKSHHAIVRKTGDERLDCSTA